MILARASRYFCAAVPSLGLALGAFVLPSAARADVMELDANGARWVAGGNENAAAGPLLTDAPAQVDLGSIIVPEAIIANVATSAAGVPAQYVAKIQELSARFDLSPSLLEALVWQESRWRPAAVSHAGARGLAQLMPGTARYLGVDPDDPMQNLEGGARYLREQLDRFDGDLEKALAAYNAGPGRVIRAGGIPNIRETRHYVAAIMGRLADHSRMPSSQ
ncbi:MAG: lytic transglycosylase domain-containing protein [Erythrobacter sp.]